MSKLPYDPLGRKNEKEEPLLRGDILTFHKRRPP